MNKKYTLKNRITRINFIKTSLTGITVKIRFVTKTDVKMNDLVSGIVYPDYPEMPSRTSSLPMPGK